MNLKSIYKNIKDETGRVGYRRAITRLVYYVLNSLIHFRHLNVIYLQREHLLLLDQKKYLDITSRFAVEDDLLNMMAEGTWEMTDALYEGFKNGDRCLLSFVKDELAGYTWIHTAGTPEIFPGFKIKIPENYIYNFAGFTLPRFRGYGLQPYRHHEILNRPEWQDKTGMIGYVDATNWSSKQGQSKSGYQFLGSIRLVGTQKWFGVFFSVELKKFGIGRIQ